MTRKRVKDMIEFLIRFFLNDIVFWSFFSIAIILLVREMLKS